MMDQPTAEDALRALEPLVGEWRVDGGRARRRALARRGPGERSSGTRPGRTWFATTIDMPEAPDSVSIIGCDAANGTYFQLYSDERGVCRVFEMSIGESEWKLSRQGEPFPQRFSAVQRRRPGDLRPLGKGRGRSELHDRLRPDLRPRGVAEREGVGSAVIARGPARPASTGSRGARPISPVPPRSARNLNLARLGAEAIKHPCRTGGLPRPEVLSRRDLDHEVERLSVAVPEGA